MPGFGGAPYGSMPFGFYTAGSSLPVPLDPATTGARLVDPITGDYRIAADGNFTEVSPLVQRVVYLLRTALRSSSEVPTVGFDAPDKIGDGFESAAISAVYAALAPLGSDVTINSVTVDRSTRNPLITVSFSDPNGTTWQVTQ